ncbi:hypothetical protein SKa4_00064 [Pseudomonas phage vB_PpuM-SKa-4]
MSRFKTMYGNVKVWGMFILAILLAVIAAVIWLIGAGMVLVGRAGGVLQRIGAGSWGASADASEHSLSIYNRIRPKKPNDPS